MEQSKKDLIGKAPFHLGDEVFPWSNLDPSGVHLIAAVTADNQDLAKIVEVDENEMHEMR